MPFGPRLAVGSCMSSVVTDQQAELVPSAACNRIRNSPDGERTVSTIRGEMKIPSQVLLSVLVLVCLTPFLGKALHIDDTLFIWAGQQIAGNPGDPFGLPVTWYTTAQPMWEVS